MTQGNFLAICSDPETISRNSGIVWAMLQVLLVFKKYFKSTNYV